ncbi:MAG: DUF6232 family protein [Sulfuricella sp.]
MDEKSFFNENGVGVSNVRFIAQGQTHAMSGVTSVKAFRKNPPRKALIFMGIMGVIELGFGNTFMTVLGLAIIAGAVAMWLFTKPKFSVMLSSASGESSALTSKDGEFISRVVGALNDAIVYRG